jgi:hypothetical protein
MNILNSPDSSPEATAINTLIEISQKYHPFTEVNSDLELLKWLKKPSHVERLPPKRSRPSTASGSRPVSARSDLKITKPNEPKCFLMKKVSIEAPCGPVLLNFIKPPIVNKLKGRSNSLKPESRQERRRFSCGERKTHQSINISNHSQMVNRIKFGCLEVYGFSRFLGNK